MTEGQQGNAGGNAGDRITGAVNDSVMIRELPAGAQVRLRNGAAGEVTQNPGDGGWIYVRYTEFPADEGMIGSEELVFCTDVVWAKR